MANWAYTSYAVEGSKETLKKLEQAILYPDIQEGSAEGWEGNVLRALGITWKQNSPDGSGYYMRGFINDEPWWQEEDYAILRFDAEEAWGITDFDEVLTENFPELKVYWSTEETGMGIYKTNDKEGKYFPERFWVDTCIDGNYRSEYFKNEEAVYNWLSGITDGKVKNAQDAEDFNSDYENSEASDENFIYIHQFTICD